MNLKLLRTSIIICCFIFTGAGVQAQSQVNYFVPQPFPRSPTATAFEKYGTYQVNEFTGVPDISIPLYTIEAGGFQVPITLSYHASGVKVTDVASWAGLGWSVNGISQITRRVMGIADDQPYGYLNGFMWSQAQIADSINTIDGMNYLENVANGTYDSKPDIYSYDFPGHSGKFFFDGSAFNGSYPIRMLPYAPIKVSYAKGEHFTIADEHGNNYLFGDADVETTYSSTSGHPTTVGIQSAWKIENMISQNRRDTVSFTYQGDEVSYPSADGEIYTVIDQIYNNTGVPYYQNPSYSLSPTTPGNANVTTEQLPAQINFKNGKVVFDLDPLNRLDVDGTGGNHAYGLQDIKVYQYNYGTKVMELQKTVVFYKSYFNAVNSSPRLRLDSIQILDKAGSIVQHYRFDYNTSISLPGYTSPQQDYWGYYNGKANNMLTPQQMVLFQPYWTSSQTYVPIGGSILNGRNPDSTYMQAYVLTGIHYPTGGYSTFTYQTNQYLDTGVLLLAGGLRIKTISSYDGVSPTPIVKTYVYNSARANFYLDYDYFWTSQVHRYYIMGTEGIEEAYETVRSFSSNPHCDLEAYDGATVVYPSVSEYIGTPGTNIGRTDYTFSDQEDAISDATMAGNLIYISSFYVRGHLLTKNDYISKGAGLYQHVKALSNSYTAFPYTDYNSVGLAVKKIYYNEGPAAQNPFPPGHAYPDDTNSFLYPTYYIVSDDNYLTSTSTNIYDTNDTTKFTTNTSIYYYDNIVHQQVTRTYHTDSKGNTSVTRTQYPADYPAGNPIIDSMVNRNMQAEAIEKYDTLKNAATGVNAIISGQLNQYAAGGIFNTIAPAKISTLSVAAPLTNFIPSTVASGALTSDSRYVQMISFDQYDTQNNLLHYTPRNATPTAIMWDYSYELPVAQIKNVPPVSSSIYYAYTGFETTGTGNWTYTGTPLYDATAPMGFYSYPLSSGSITVDAAAGSTGYVLSYWSNNGPAVVSVYGAGSYTSTALNTVNNWTYYEVALPASGSLSYITVSGTNTSIDELRLYPANSQMTTYAYDPSGVRGIADTKGMNSYFQYDYAQRLKYVQDWAGNIVKGYGYHNYDQLFANQTQTATFTRNNCPYGTTPGYLIYTVPANKYYSSTLLSANADAMYDMNLNGQIKANTNCHCPITYITISTNNTTGIVNFPVYFYGISMPFLINTGVSHISVPEGTYTIATIGPGDSNSHTYTWGTRPVQPAAQSQIFNNVSITPGSSDLSITIN